MRSSAVFRRNLGTAAPVAAILLSGGALRADGAGDAPAGAAREELALLHTSAVKAPFAGAPFAGAAPEAPGGALEMGTAVPAASRADQGAFSFRNAPDLRSLRPPLPPWVHAGEIGLPRLYEEEVSESRPLELSPWVLFAERLDCRRAAFSFDARSEHDGASLFYIPPPRETQVARKVRKLATERMFKEIRRHLRRYWKSQFRDHPSLSYADYEQRLVQINNIGKDPSERDYFNVEYTTNEFKQGLLRKERTDAESDLPLLTWGPVTVTDSGSVKFDVGTAANAEAEDATIDVGEERRRPILGSKNYEVDTSFITDVNPFRGYTEGDVSSMVRRLGVEVKVDWLTDVLSRKVVSAEFECTADLEGEYGVFVNFVIHSR
jgi:hypothetical protein